MRRFKSAVKWNPITIYLTYTRFSRPLDGGGDGVTTGGKSAESFLSDEGGVDGKGEETPGDMGEVGHCQREHDKKKC